MGHCMKALIGRNETIEKLGMTAIPLPQGYSMIHLTDELFDQITESSGITDTLNCSELVLFTSAISRLMETYSAHSLLAYVETDYFGGEGLQGGVLFQDGAIVIGPASGEGTINRILKAIGVRIDRRKDEFDALELGRYRSNPAG